MQMDHQTKWQIYEEMQHEADKQDVLTALHWDNPEDACAFYGKTAQEMEALLADGAFIDTVAKEYRRNLDNDDTWMVILQDTLFSILRK